MIKKKSVLRLGLPQENFDEMFSLNKFGNSHVIPTKYHLQQWPLKNISVNIVVLNISVGIVEREGALVTDGVEILDSLFTKLFNLYFPIFKMCRTILPRKAVVIN